MSEKQRLTLSRLLRWTEKGGYLIGVDKLNARELENTAPGHRYSATVHIRAVFIAEATGRTREAAVVAVLNLIEEREPLRPEYGGPVH
jgi:hypothetical protein